MSILSIDFGGTRTRAAWFSWTDGAVTLVQRDETPSLVDQPAQSVVDRIIETARRVIPAGASPRVIGIAAPGPLDPKRGVIHHALTLPGWKDIPLSEIIADAFGHAPTFMQNDANLAALAEYQFGAARGCDPAIYLTISTGIGGGAVLGGKLFSGWNGLAIEPGHVRFTLPDGQIKRLEELASGTGIATVARNLLLLSDTPSTLRDIQAVTGQAVGIAAQAGDPLAKQVIENAGHWLGLGLVDILHLFNPRVIVVGGSVSKLGSLIFDPAKVVIRREILHPDFYADDMIRHAQLGDDVCLYGAAWFAAQNALS